jgi:transcriptional regulator with XRE-family HTH domain
MNGFRENLWEQFKDKLFRQAYVIENVRTGIAFQIKAMREARGWSQSDLAKRADKTQSAVARLEDPDYGKFSVQTLLEIAAAFDVWLSIEFVPFSKGLQRTSNRSPGALNAVSFSDDGESMKPVTAPQLLIYVWDQRSSDPNWGFDRAESDFRPYGLSYVSRPSASENHGSMRWPASGKLETKGAPSGAKVGHAIQ